MVLFPMILFLPLELGFVFSGFEETGFLSFSSTRCVHVCVLWIPMRMSCLDYRVASFTTRMLGRKPSLVEARGAAITRRDECATCWIRGPSTGQRPKTLLNPHLA